MKLFPYLNFPGNCEEALNFYKEALDGEIIQIGALRRIAHEVTGRT